MPRIHGAMRLDKRSTEVFRFNVPAATGLVWARLQPRASVMAKMRVVIMNIVLRNQVRSRDCALDQGGKKPQFFKVRQTTSAVAKMKR